MGTTSAYAEKSSPWKNGVIIPRNYLRIRGEEVSPSTAKEALMELPPHTRRRVHAQPAVEDTMGTTSAYAEKSNNLHIVIGKPKNYLRIRGEEATGK